MGEDGWTARIEAHRAAVGRFARSAEAVPEADWTRSASAEKWSPGQVAEHIAITYRLLVAELDGSQGMRSRLPLWKRLYIRWRFLPGILREGHFPRTRAPREIRPPGEPRERTVVLQALTGDARRFEEGLTEARAHGGGALTHPYFGRLRPAKMLGLITAHTEHHRRQLPGD